MDSQDNLYKSDEEQERIEPVTRLVDGIDLRDLIENTTSFTIDAQPDQFVELRGYEGINDDVLSNVRFPSIVEDQEGDPDAEPFAQIASKMLKVTSDGKLMKRELCPGIGPVVPQGSYVTVHYNGYCEYADEPFDSTYMRGRSQSFWLEENEGSPVITGLYGAISNMKKGEKSQFLVHPDLAFGKMGCPPRIPPDAEILFEVEMIHFSASAIEDILTTDINNEMQFVRCYKTAERESASAGEMFHKKNIRGAIQKYRHAINMLEASEMKSIEEEDKQKTLLLKLFTNLAICYNAEKKPKPSIIASNNALHINAKHPKALFARARAFIMLQNFSEAEKCLKTVQKLKPNNKEVDKELLKLSKEKHHFEQKERLACARMFTSS